MANKLKMKPKRSEYLKFKDEWYKKLKDSGFKDIEYKDGSINPAHLRRQQKHPVYREAIEEYYYMCYHFLHEYKFADEIEKVIWEYHTEGIGVRDIADTLRKVKLSKIKKSMVFYILKKLEQEMKSRYLQV
jgi:hypothetical protein